MNASEIYLEKAEKSCCMLFRWIYEVTLRKICEIYKCNRSKTQQPHKTKQHQKIKHKLKETKNDLYKSILFSISKNFT